MSVLDPPVALHDAMSPIGVKRARLLARGSVFGERRLAVDGRSETVRTWLRSVSFGVESGHFPEVL